MGIPEYEAKRYEGRVKEGGHSPLSPCRQCRMEKRAKEILEQTGAFDVGSAGEAKADFAKSDRPHHRNLREL